jgi:hypothetical protein
MPAGPRATLNDVTLKRFQVLEEKIYRSPSHRATNGSNVYVAYKLPPLARRKDVVLRC